MPRRRTVTSPSFDPGDIGGGGGSDNGGGDSDGGGSTGPSRQGRDDRTDGDAGATITDPAPSPDPTPDPDSSGGGSAGGSTGPSRQGRDDRTDGDAGAEVTAPAPDAGSDSGTDSGPQFGPGPGTDGGLGGEDPGGDGNEIVNDTVEAADDRLADVGVPDRVGVSVPEFSRESTVGPAPADRQQTGSNEIGVPVGDAEANDEIVRRATTGGFLSERGESAGLFPATVGDGGGAAIGDGRVDISETRLRETAADAQAFGQSIDASDAFSSPADPLASGGIAGPTAADPGAVDTTDAPPGTENAVEEAVEGAAAVPFDLPGAALETETAAEAGQSLLVDDLVADFGAGTVGETAVAQGRDRAIETGAAIRENPAGFAGAVTAGAVIGAGGLSRGSTGTLRQAARAELDPRIGPFGRTFETRVARGARDFLADDRGQAELLTRPEGRESGGSTGETATDDDLGPDVGPFDRSDARLFDPNREFDDGVGGMQDAGPTVDPSDATSRQDIGTGVGGRGEPGIVGSDAESFSSRGFGDVEGTELDPNPAATLRDDASVLGGGAGGLFAAPEPEPATGSGAGGLLGAPSDLDATGASPDLGERTRTVTTPFFDADDAVDTGTTADQPTDVFSDQPTDTGQDTPTDLFDSPTADTPTADTPTTDQPTDRPTDQPSDTPSDVPTDRPDDPPERFPFEFDSDPEDDGNSLLTRADDTTVVNPTRTLSEVDDEFVDQFDGGGAGGP